jgi:hypothetical protein
MEQMHTRGCQAIDEVGRFGNVDSTHATRFDEARVFWSVGPEIPSSNGLFLSWRAQEIINLVRACDFFPLRSPWGNPRVKICDQPGEILKVRRTGQLCSSPAGTVGEREGSGALVASTDEWVLLEKLRIDGTVVNGGDVLPKGVRLEALAP